MPRLDTATHGFINWEWNGHDIYNFIRAFDEPYMGASTFYKNKKIYLSNVKILEIKKTFHPFQSGLIVRKDKKSIYIAMRNGLLKISTIKNENFKKYNISYFNLGERLHTPSNILDKAKTGKSSHTGKGIKITYG